MKEEDLTLEKEAWSEVREEFRSEERRKAEEKEGREVMNHKGDILMMK